jgi:endonuclease YncB( thermonuclease family)
VFHDDITNVDDETGIETVRAEAIEREPEKFRSYPGLTRKTYDATPAFPFCKTEWIPAYVGAVYDGDTFTAVFHMPPPAIGARLKMRIRIAGINAPEMSVSTGVQAREAQQHLEFLVMDRIVELQLLKWDKYGGRIVANVRVADGGAKKQGEGIFTDVAQDLLDHGYAVPYDGTTSKN